MSITFRCCLLFSVGSRTLETLKHGLTEGKYIETCSAQQQHESITEYNGVVQVGFLNQQIKYHFEQASILIRVDRTSIFQRSVIK